MGGVKTACFMEQKEEKRRKQEQKEDLWSKKMQHGGRSRGCEGLTALGALVAEWAVQDSEEAARVARCRTRLHEQDGCTGTHSQGTWTCHPRPTPILSAVTATTSCGQDSRSKAVQSGPEVGDDHEGFSQRALNREEKEVKNSEFIINIRKVPGSASTNEKFAGTNEQIKMNEWRSEGFVKRNKVKEIASTLEEFVIREKQDGLRKCPTNKVKENHAGKGNGHESERLLENKQGGNININNVISTKICGTFKNDSLRCNGGSGGKRVIGGNSASEGWKNRLMERNESRKRLEPEGLEGVPNGRPEAEWPSRWIEGNDDGERSNETRWFGQNSLSGGKIITDGMKRLMQDHVDLIGGQGRVERYESNHGKGDTDLKPALQKDKNVNKHLDKEAGSDVVQKKWNLWENTQGAVVAKTFVKVPTAMTGQMYTFVMVGPQAYKRVPVPSSEPAPPSSAAIATQKYKSNDIVETPILSPSVEHVPF